MTRGRVVFVWAPACVSVWDRTPRNECFARFRHQVPSSSNVPKLDVSYVKWESFGMDETGQFVSTEAAAHLLGVSAQRVRTLLRDGTVAGMRQGRGWLVEAGDLERYRRDREASGRRRSGGVPGEPSVTVAAGGAPAEGLSPAQLGARLQELQGRVEELSRRNEELEEQLRRVRLLAELLRAVAPAGAAQG